MPDVETEIRLIEMYGSRVIAVTLNGTGGSPDELQGYARRLSDVAGIPVVLPLQEAAYGMPTLMPLITRFIQEHDRLPDTSVRIGK
jgi:hypothetical protein